MLVLCTVIVDGGVQVSEVVIQHLSKEGVVVGCLQGLLEVVFAHLAHLLIHHRDGRGGTGVGEVADDSVGVATTT